MGSGPAASRMIFGSGIAFLTVFLNTPIILSITKDYLLLHLAANILGLYGFSLWPHVMLHDRIINVDECARLFRALTIGLGVGAVTLLALAASWGYLFDAAFAIPLLLATNVILFLIGYNSIFSNFFQEIIQKERVVKAEADAYLFSAPGFRTMWIFVNAFSSPPIIGLILFSQFILGTELVVFQAVVTYVGMRLQGWSQEDPTIASQSGCIPGYEHCKSSSWRLSAPKIIW